MRRDVAARQGQGTTSLDHDTHELGEPTGSGPLDGEQLRLIDAYWRAANYLSVGQIYLLDNPLLREPASVADHCLRSHHDINVIVAGKQPAQPTLLVVPEKTSRSRPRCGHSPSAADEL